MRHAWVDVGDLQRRNLGDAQARSEPARRHPAARPGTAQIVSCRRDRRPSKEGRDPSDIADVVALRLLAELAQGRVVDQPLLQRTDRWMENRIGIAQPHSLGPSRVAGWFFGPFPAGRDFSFPN